MSSRQWALGLVDPVRSGVDLGLSCGASPGRDFRFLVVGVVGLFGELPGRRLSLWRRGWWA